MEQKQPPQTPEDSVYYYHYQSRRIRTELIGRYEQQPPQEKK